MLVPHLAGLLAALVVGLAWVLAALVAHLAGPLAGMVGGRAGDLAGVAAPGVTELGTETRRDARLWSWLCALARIRAVARIAECGALG